MDISALDQGAVWAQIAPAIEARHREIAERMGGPAANGAVQATDAVAERPVGQASDANTQRYGGNAQNTDPQTPQKTSSGAEVGPDGLTNAERAMVEKLSARDAEVRRHEQAHMMVGGQYASAPSYTYQSGPDGNRYAIGGEVRIDVSPVRGDPQATINKMEVVKAAALAPAEPSPADRQIASYADQMMARATAELMELRFAQQQGETEGLDLRA